LLSFADKQKRRQRFSYHRFSREQMKRRKNLCTDTSGNQLCKIKGSELTEFVVFPGYMAPMTKAHVEIRG